MSTSKEERVRVAVRVRPFIIYVHNQKETAKGCKRIIEMDGSTTSLVNPADPTDRKTYSFDYSYWSFDGFIQDSSGKNVADANHPRGNQYSDQKRLFDDLGRKMLSDAFDGYNSTLFSYGQTGSGKSYSVIGYGPNEGIIPQLCHEIFRTFDERDWSLPHPVLFEIHLSMLEIYNETVHDLLRTSRSPKGLKVREHPKKGFYADGLSSFLVTSYSEIDKLIKQGTLNRTVVATNMNATSSRSHTIVSFSIVQKKKSKDGEVTTTAVLNVVDLAGSERVSKVGNTSSERFREGIAINQSLQCLGKCIHALAETSASSTSTNPQNNNKRIPYRDSVLTKLLMNALGGNSKTIMIASISAADIHYEETLSTLRYADRAKQIRTQATVNQDPTDKLMRDLKTENQRLKAVLTRGNIDSQWIKNTIHNRPNNPQGVKETRKKWEDEIRAQIVENEREMNQIRVAGKPDKVDTIINDTLPISLPLESQPDKERVTGPYLENINMDPLLNGRWLHYLKQGSTVIGKSFSGPSGIEMLGPGMQSNHAEITVREDKITLKSLTENGRVMVNGEQVDRRERVLQPNDRLVFGATQMWVFRHPAVEAKGDQFINGSMINYDFILNEIATKSGLDVIPADSANRQDSVQEEIVGILPLVEEANEISAEMDKRVKFEIVVVAPQVLSNNSTDKTMSSQVYIKMRNLDQGMEYLWSKDKFTTRFDYMKELYRHYQLKNNEDDEDDIDFIVPDDRDPFLELPDATVIIGVARILLQSLAYSVEMQEQVPITDLRGIQIGFMEIAIIPCADAKGNPLSEDHMVDSIDQLIGRNLYFEFHIINCQNLPPKFRDLYCKYKFYGDKVESRTEMYPYSQTIEFNYHRMLRCEPANQDFIDFLNHGSVVVEILGKHDLELQSFHHQPYLQSTNDRHSREDEITLSRSGEIVMSGDLPSMNKSGFNSIGGKKQELLAELQLVKQTHLRIQQRLDFIRQVIDRCLLVGQETVPTTLLDAMLNVNSLEDARQIIQQLQAEAQDGADWMDWNVTTPNNREQRSSVCSIC